MREYVINEKDVETIELAVDTLRQIIKGNTSSDGEEAILALKSLMCILPRIVQ